jgi:hypothetical protein
MGFLGDHCEKALVRMVGTCRPSSAADSTVEAFETASGAQVFAIPDPQGLFQTVIGDG